MGTEARSVPSRPTTATRSPPTSSTATSPPRTIATTTMKKLILRTLTIAPRRGHGGVATDRLVRRARRAIPAHAARRAAPALDGQQRPPRIAALVEEDVARGVLPVDHRVA